VVETLTTTPEHPFYVVGRGYVDAGQLGIGSLIVTRAGPAVVVQSYAVLSRPEGYTVYNLEVEDNHAYFVGKTNGGVWVHNYDPWIAKDLYSRLDPELRAAFERALKNGLVGDRGEEGIKRLAGKGIDGYSYELKILGRFGKYRLLGNRESVTINGVTQETFVFRKLIDH